MKLFKQKSERIRESDGKAYLDLFMCWKYLDKFYAVRVRPQFGRDYDKLCAVAVEVPAGEMLEKYY